MNNTFNRPFVGDIILKQILTLPALELPSNVRSKVSTRATRLIYAARTPTLGRSNDSAT